jgi:predicted O-methyltransferase YrrM
VIIGDNVVRNGAVADSASTDRNVIGVRQFFDLMAQHPRLSATAIQTVGSKGYDGFSIAIVNT